MATKNITPRNNNEGKIGTNSKKWAEGHFESLSVAGQSVSGGGATALNGLTDVTISSVQNNQVLKYNGSNWTNAAAPATLSDTNDLSEGSSNLYFTNERVDDRVNNLLTLPSNSNLSLTYDDNANTLSISAADIAYSTKDILILGGSSNKTSNTSGLTNDYGVCFRGYDNSTSSAKNGFFGYDESVDAFVFYESIVSASNNAVTPNSGDDLYLGKIYTSRIDLKFKGTSTPTDDQIRFYEKLPNGSGYIGVKAPNSLPGNYTLTLPTSNGNANQVLKTDGNGVLSWVDQASGGGSGDIESVAAGDGLSGGGTTGAVSLALDLNELTAADVNVANDSIAIIDADASNGSKKESITDLMTAVAGNGLSSSSGVISTSPQVIAVTVSGGKFLLDGVSQKVDSLVKGVKYRFDQSHSTNLDHPFRFSTASDGGGSSYTTGVTTAGSPASSGAYTEIIVPHSAPSTLYYYCTNHSGMGASVQTEVIAGSGLDKTASTLSVDKTVITGQNVKNTAADNDLIIISDTSDSGNLKKMTRAVFTAGLGGGGGSSTTLQSTVSSTLTLSGATSGTHVWIFNGSTITITLPTTGITNGTIYHLKNINSTKAVISGPIDNVTSKDINQYDNLTVVATGSGSQWYII